MHQQAMSLGFLFALKLYFAKTNLSDLSITIEQFSEIISDKALKR